MTDEEKRKFGNRLLLLMEERNIQSYQILGDQLGISRQAVARYVYGQAVPRPDTLLLMADALGVTTDYLLGREGKND